jgi:tRNA-binding EMAP/Myf-like protein
MSDTHKVPIVRIEEIRKHPNADTLGLVDVGGYQVVVKLDDFKPGDLGVYIQPDSIVPETEPFKFLWQPATGPIPVKKRRITVRKFRKEWSEGLLLSAKEFPELALVDAPAVHIPEVGDDVAERLGITRYDPDAGKELPEDNERAPGRRQNKIWPRSLKGWAWWLWYKITRNPTGSPGNEKAPESFRPIYDVDAWKNNKDAFVDGEIVIVTEKIHGSNARFTFDDAHMYAGSRKLWKKAGTHNVWRNALKSNPWIEEWCRASPGYTLYGEVVPTQDGYDYGATTQELRFFVFDVLDPQGKWLPLLDSDGTCPFMEIAEILQHWVPPLYKGPYSESAVAPYIDGPSMVPGAKHIREGIVIRPVVEREIRNLGRLQLKIVSNDFLDKESK